MALWRLHHSCMPVAQGWLRWCSRATEQALALLRTYKDRLGLDISRVAPETVRMAFSLLDERDPSREFSFVLGLSKDCYHVKDCALVVPELNKLLEELNNACCSVSALPRFVCSMRRCFLKA